MLTCVDVQLVVITFLTHLYHFCVSQLNSFMSYMLNRNVGPIPTRPCHWPDLDLQECDVSCIVATPVQAISGFVKFRISFSFVFTRSLRKCVMTTDSERREGAL